MVPGHPRAEALTDSTQIKERRFRTDVGMMVASRVAVVILGIAQSVVAARALGPDARGLVAAAISASLILTQIGTFGLTAANPYFVAREHDLRQSLIDNSLWFAIGGGGLLAGIGLGLQAVLPDAFPDLSSGDLALALSGLPPALAAALLQSILLGEGRTVAYNGVAVAVAILPLVALVAVEVVARLDATSALVVIAFGQYAAAALFAIALRIRSIGRLDIALLRRTTGYGLRIYAAAMLSFLLIRLDMLLVNGYLGAGPTGQYAVSVALVDGLTLLPVAVGFNLFARVARGSGIAFTALVLRHVAVAFALVCALAFLLAGPVIRLLYGDAFTPAVELFRWLLPGAYALGLLSILSQHFAGSNYPPKLIVLWIAGLAVNLAINITLLADEGAYVAGLSSSVAYALVLVGHLALFRRHLEGSRAAHAAAG